MLIDVHAHVGRLGPRRTSYFSTSELILKMDAWGVEKSCVLPLHDCPEGWYFCTTEEVITECARYPARLIPFCLIDPRFGDNSPDMDFSDLLEEYKERGCKGMGEMVANVYFDDPRALNLFRQAGRAGLPVLFDMMPQIGGCYGIADDPRLPRLERALRELPETIFIGHGPSFWAEIADEPPPADRLWWYPPGPIKKPGAVPRLMAKYANLWADISARSGYNAITREPQFGVEFLDQFQDKLLFGTDYVINRDRPDAPAPIVGYFKSLLEHKKLSESAYRRIGWENAQRLLGL